MWHTGILQGPLGCAALPAHLLSGPSAQFGPLFAQGARIENLLDVRDALEHERSPDLGALRRPRFGSGVLMSPSVIGGGLASSMI